MKRKKTVISIAVCVGVLVATFALNAALAQQGNLASYISSCRANNGTSCLYAGRAYRASNTRQAAEFLTRACRLNVAEGCVEAGDLYSRTDPGRAHRMYVRALQLWGPACTGGNAAACAADRQLRARLGW